MSYRPLSKRDVYDPDLDTLHEGIEPWMLHPVLQWLGPFIWDGYQSFRPRSATKFIEGFELRRRERRPFSRQTLTSAAREVEERTATDPEFAIDLLAYALWTMNGAKTMVAPKRVVDLEQILRVGGSAWQATATRSEDDTFRFDLTRRDLSTTKTAISDVPGRPGELLIDAWLAIARRDPDARGGYDCSVKAVEAAMHPVVSPGNDRATLGTMTRDMRAKPGKWTFVLGDIERIVGIAEMLWTAHVRHGTDTRPEHTIEEADAALHLAIPLVRYFTGGLVTRSGGSS